MRGGSHHPATLAHPHLTGVHLNGVSRIKQHYDISAAACVKFLHLSFTPLAINENCDFGTLSAPWKHRSSTGCQSLSSFSLRRLGAQFKPDRMPPIGCITCYSASWIGTKRMA
mmetsp:Transcript_12158/g.27827  ORF Transcript_12158/g.27827 Transcript_12158/m.27827 type:complete len:113 (-) Transcript_12158:109-447(-)